MDEDYLKMILALPDEFFEGWEFNDGDQVYLIEEIDDYSTSKDYGLYTVFDGLLANEGLLITENWLYVRVIDFKNGRPIPSQEQLQDMVIYKFNGVPEIQLLESFYGWVKTQRSVDKKFEFQSIKCSMLRYAVLMLLRKEWNGEAWL